MNTTEKKLKQKATLRTVRRQCFCDVTWQPSRESGSPSPTPLPVRREAARAAASPAPPPLASFLSRASQAEGEKKRLQ